MSDFIVGNQVKKTRKDHPCEWCPEIIETGSAAYRIVASEDGSAKSHFWHPECHKVAGSYQDYDPHWEDFTPRSQQRGVEYQEKETDPAPPKTKRAAGSAMPLSVDQAVKVLNTGGFRTQTIPKDKSITWFHEPENIAARDDLGNYQASITPQRAVHAARILIRRAKPITVFAQILSEVQEPHSEFDASKEIAKGESNA